ncbi:MAG TPA: hypothetical protein VGD43_14285, partial [Micromonospora sp.]
MAHPDPYGGFESFDRRRHDDPIGQRRSEEATARGRQMAARPEIAVRFDHGPAGRQVTDGPTLPNAPVLEPPKREPAAPVADHTGRTGGWPGAGEPERRVGPSDQPEQVPPAA